MPTIFLLLLMLLGPLVGRGAILTVPGQYPGIQAAMDASAPGDTVHVARGTWFGLYTSPTHSLTLCSDYLFTQDSTDINETILDGESLGTIVDVVADRRESFTLCGFTLQNGLGQHVSPQCDRGAAVNVMGDSHTLISDTVFRNNRAPSRAAILMKNGLCSTGLSSYGALTLKNIACFQNELFAPTGGATGAFFVKMGETRLIIDGLYYDGNGNDTRPIYTDCYLMDSLNISNVTLTNSEAELAYFNCGTRNPNGLLFRNWKSFAEPGSNSCKVGIVTGRQGTPSATMVVRNFVFWGIHGHSAFYLGTDSCTADIDSLTIWNCRNLSDTPSLYIDASIPGSLRNLHMHHNTSGDSLTHVARSLLYTINMDIDGAHVHDNRAILAQDPQAAQTGGHYVAGAMIHSFGLNPVLQNMVFVNNRVDDLDDYSNHSPAAAYHYNPGRELYAFGWNSLTARNIRISHSRQPNHCPEVYAPADIDLATVGSTIALGAKTLHVYNLLVEDADDGGLAVGGNSLWINTVMLRNVGRAGILMGRYENPTGIPYYRFWNLNIENVDAVDNFLLPPYQFLSNQAVLFMDVIGDYEGIDPTVDFQNVTVTGCDGMRHLFNFFEPVNLRVRNCLFWNNTYGQLVEYDDPITQTWEYDFLQEDVPGTGNQVGIDPWIHEELGAPWLSPISPAIDAGHPDLVYNDIEDPDNPGFALWPSQGTLRNDIGYTGGRYAGTLDHLVDVRKPVTDPPARPAVFTLHPAYPNPFNPSTTLSYTLDHPMQIELSVYNLLGQQVRTLAFGLQDAGEHSVPFTTGELASGVYVVELKAGGHTQTRKVLLLK